DLSDVPYMDSTAGSTRLCLCFSSEGGKTRSALWRKRASVENAQNHQRRIAFPHVPDARRCNRRSHAGWHSLVKKGDAAPPLQNPFSAAISESRINVPSERCSSA